MSDARRITGQLAFAVEALTRCLAETGARGRGEAH